MNSTETELTFENATAELENIVCEMENGEIPLEKLIEQFEKGMKLSTLCRQKLKALEQKIEILTREDTEDGKWSPLDTAEQSTDKKTPRKKSGVTTKSVAENPDELPF